MIWNVVWLLFATIMLTSTNARAACRYGPEEVIQCDTPQEEIMYLQKRAEQQKAEEAERTRAGQEREQAYCAANPNSTDCRDTNWVSNGGLNCPAGQISSGGPPTSAMCIPDTSKIPIPEPRPAGAGAPSGTTTVSRGTTAIAPANQDAQVSSAADQQATRCKEAAESAVSTCDSAMNSIRSLAGQVSQRSGAISQGGASGCAQMGQTANNAGNQMQSQRNSCQSAVSSCNSTCDSALSSLSHAPSSAASVRASQARARCQSASASMSTMDMNINQVRTAANQANQCYQQATGSSIPGMGNTASDTPSLMAANTPVLDCSNPQVAQSNPVCICRDNPGHSMCGSSTASSDYLGGARAIKPDTISGVTRDSNVGLLGAEDEAALPPGYVPSRTGRFAQQTGGAGQIGSGASGALPAPANFRGGARDSRYNPDVLKGAHGANGGGRRANGGGYAEMDGTSPGRGTARGATKGKTAANAVDLRRFLPQDGRTAGRGPASANGSIGLRHTNIWTTVNGRYNRVSDSLDP